MKDHGRILVRRCLAPLALVLACGCLTPHGPVANHPATTTAGASPATQTANAAAGSSGVVPAGGPGYVLPLNLAPAESPYDQISQMSQRLATCDDERKLLVKRVSDMDALLHDKDMELQRRLGEVSDDIEKSRDELTRAQIDLRRQRQQIADLGERLRMTERDKIESLDKINKDLERILQEREGGGKPELVPPPGAP
jgi:hypothetical protein